MNSDRFSSSRVLALTFLLLLFAGLIHAADWPRWRGPSNNGHSIESISELSSSPKILWKKKLGAGFSSPVVAGGNVVIMDAANGKEVVRLLNAKNGGEHWMAEIDEVFGDTQGPAAPRNTPLIDGDRVYAVSCRGQLVCLSMKNGFPIWDVNYVRDLGAEFIGEKGKSVGAARHGNDGSPTVDGPHIIAPVGGLKGNSVVCFDKISGDVIWHSQNDVAGYGSPVVAEIAGIKQVVVFTVDGAIGLRRDTGELLWRIPLKTGYGRHVVTPIVWNDIVVVGSHEVGLIGIKVTKDGTGVKAQEIWTNKNAAPNFSHPINRGQYLFGLGPKKQVQCVDIGSGELKWNKTGLMMTSANKAYAGFINVGENILQLTDAGELILYKATADRYDEISRTQVIGMNWCNPALSDGVLYLRDGMKDRSTLYAVRLE